MSKAIQRIESLLDEHSFVELGALVTSRSTDFNLNDRKAPSDGVVIGHGLIDDNLVFVFSQDASVLNGTIGEMHAKKILSVYDMAVKMGAPVIGLLDCAGVRLQESLDAMESLGAIYRKAVEASGAVPQIMGVFGNCGGGLSVLTSVSDFTFMEKDAKLFLNTPNAIGGNREDKLDTAGADFQYSEAGNVDFVGTEQEIFAAMRQLVIMLPGCSLEDGRVDACLDDLNRASEGMEDKLCDAAAFAAEISDNRVFVECKAGFASEMVTGLIKLNGATVGVVGNRQTGMESLLTADGCGKAADFVRFCDAFDIPVLSLTNVTGYEATIASEKLLTREAARMTAAFAEASVPKINFITKEAYGSAYVLMNSKALGADLVYAYDTAKIGIMDSALAAKIMYEDKSADEISEKAKEFEELQSGIAAAAARGYVDRIITPADTRKYLIAGFEMLFTKRTDGPFKKHSTK